MTGAHSSEQRLGPRCPAQIPLSLCRCVTVGRKAPSPLDGLLYISDPERSRWANADAEKLGWQGHEGAGYFGVIQVVAFCNGKVSGGRVPAERGAERGPDGGEVTYTQLTGLCVR